MPSRSNKEEPSGPTVLVDDVLDCGEQVWRALDLVQDQRLLVAAEEAVGFEIRGGRLGGVVEVGVSGVRPDGSGESGLAGLAWAGQEDC